MATQQPFLGRDLTPSQVLEGVVLDGSHATYRLPRSGWLGVKVCLVPLEPVHTRRLGQSAGLGVQRVSKGSPAARAGLRKADLLLSVDDFITDSDGSLRRALAGRSRGDCVRLRLIRDGRVIEVPAQVGDTATGS